MNLKGLSFENMPPLQVPLRYFQTAPFLGMLAALLLLWYPEALDNRWQPPLLAFTHLLTLGFAATLMLGALFQVMPVVTGQTLPKARWVAPVVRWALVCGTLLLAGGFLSGTPLLYLLASLLLVCSLMTFLGAFGWALIKTGPVGDSAYCLRLAALSLLATVLLGAFQLSYQYWPEGGLYHPVHTNLHAAWGGFGWSLGLIIAVAIQVIPMFHVAPSFHRWVPRRLAPLLFALLVLLSLPVGPSLQMAAIIGISICAAAFAITALQVLNGRKRKRVDWTVRFWQLGLAHLLVTASLLLLYPLAQWVHLSGPLALLIGLGFGLGFVVSVMVGMLQKIVPFLVYLHLQRASLSKPVAMMNLPNMKVIISSDLSRKQFYLHALALALIYFSVAMPWLRPTAALVLLADFAWLAYSLFRAARCYANTLRMIDTTASTTQ
jgi:hypothetical protein